MFTLDSVIPRFPLTCIATNHRDLAICCPTGIYIIEDYGLQSIKRRFFPLEQEFRALTYTASNSSELICLSADGQSIWCFDALDGNLKLVLQSENAKFTSIQMKSETELLVGTFAGEIITKLLQYDSIESRKYSEYPILEICNDLIHFYDSQGRLFSNQKIIFDDGILQPCRILKSSKHLLLVKHSSVYIFDSETDDFITKLTHDELITAAELDQNDNLIACTDRGNLLTFEGLKLKNLNKTDTQESEDEDEENAEDSEDSDQEVSEKSKRVFGLIKNPNASEILILKVDAIHKLAWIEEVPITSAITNQVTKPLNTFTVQLAADVICPLCNESQTLLINTKSCSKGHPIAICSQTKQFIITKGYNCRSCNCSFTTNPKTCPYCKGLITK